MISRAQMTKQISGDAMPIRKVKGGYKWGSKGKVYKDRKGAERQAAAAYASGYEPKKMKSGGFVSSGSDQRDLDTIRSSQNIDDGPSKMKAGGSVKQHVAQPKKIADKVRSYRKK